MASLGDRLYQALPELGFSGGWQSLKPDLETSCRLLCQYVLPHRSQDNVGTSQAQLVINSEALQLSGLRNPGHYVPYLWVYPFLNERAVLGLFT